MLKYLLRRLFIFIPTLVVISLLAFLLISKAPGDPVSKLMNTAEDQTVNKSNTYFQEELIRKSLGLDLPLFYFSLSNLATPDTLYKIKDAYIRKTNEHLIYKYGNWNNIVRFHQSINKFISVLLVSKKQINDSANYELKSKIQNSIYLLSSLNLLWDERLLDYKINQIETTITEIKSSLSVSDYSKLKDLRQSYHDLIYETSCWKYYIPVIHFYPKNQYGQWLFGDGNWLTGKGSVYCKGIIRGDFGKSYATKLPVIEELKHRLPWSLFFTLISVILAYLISVPLGIKSAVRSGKFFDRSSTILVFILYSLPAFWFATLLLMVFANPDVFAIFPASGVGPPGGIPEGTSILKWLNLTWPHLVLPTIAYTYSSFAFISRIVKSSMTEVLNQDFIRTAKAKGLSENQIVYKHAFRNSLLPVITLFANIFPAAIGGSVILETIFSIPGMGQEIYQAIFNQDYPVVVAVFTFTGVLTLFAYLLADILYALADPRISFSNKK